MSSILTNSSRRSFLKGATATLALPFLESAFGKGVIANGAPKRMIFMGGVMALLMRIKAWGKSFFLRKQGGFLN